MKSFEHLGKVAFGAGLKTTYKLFCEIHPLQKLEFSAVNLAWADLSPAQRDGWIEAAKAVAAELAAVH